MLRAGCRLVGVGWLLSGPRRPCIGMSGLVFWHTVRFRLSRYLQEAAWWTPLCSSIAPGASEQPPINVHCNLLIQQGSPAVSAAVR